MLIFPADDLTKVRHGVFWRKTKEGKLETSERRPFYRLSLRTYCLTGWNLWDLSAAFGLSVKPWLCNRTTQNNSERSAAAFVSWTRLVLNSLPMLQPVPLIVLLVKLAVYVVWSFLAWFQYKDHKQITSIAFVVSRSPKYKVHTKDLYLIKMLTSENFFCSIFVKS